MENFVTLCQNNEPYLMMIMPFIGSGVRRPCHSLFGQLKSGFDCLKQFVFGSAESCYCSYKCLIDCYSYTLFEFKLFISSQNSI